MIKIKHTNLTSISKNFLKKLKEPEGKQKKVLDYLDQYISDSKDLLKTRFYKLLRRKFISLNSFILYKPSELEKFNEFISINHPIAKDKDVKTELKKIFYYSNYDRWGAYELAKALDVNVCPYCNRQFTFTVGTDLKKSVRPQFDHFFSQKDYPYLALCFYNLIPSCSLCNACLKRDTPFDLDNYLHPYVEGFDEKVKFKTDISVVKFIIGSVQSYTIMLKPNKNVQKTIRDLRKISNHIHIFKLKELYNMHKDYVDELIIKSQIYTKDYIKDLYNQYNGLYFNNINQVYRVIIGNYVIEDELGKRVLAKLSKDICEDLGLN